MPKRCRQGSHVYTHITRYNETSPESHTVDSGYPNHSVIDSARARGALTSQHARRGRGCYMQGPMNRRDHASSWHPIALLLAEVTSGSSGATVVHGATAAKAHGRQGTWVCEHSHTVSLSRSLAVVWSLTPSLLLRTHESDALCRCAHATVKVAMAELHARERACVLGRFRSAHAPPLSSRLVRARTALGSVSEA